MNVTYTSCGIACGYKGIMMHPKIFLTDFFQEYIPKILKNESCYVSDDFVLSNYFHLHNIPMIQTERDTIIYQTNLGFKEDALHLQEEGGGFSRRYYQCSLFCNTINKFGYKVVAPTPYE
jgi:hypothetical protein